MSKKLQDGDVMFPFGQDSSSDPVGLAPGYYSRGMNVVNRGGVIQCRPGYRCLLVLPEGVLQGFSVLRPKRGPEILVFGVNGKLYTSQYPFDTATEMEGIQLSDIAPQLYFKQVEQTITLNPDGSLSFVNPKNLLIIQDGGYTAPVIFDGTRGTHSRGNGSIPIGAMMEWIGDRLWVASGAALYASDIGNPISFTENVYISGVGFFILPQEITGMVRTLQTDFSQLLVYTHNTTHVFQASIRDRSTWASTPNFQKIVFDKIGCVSARSIKFHYGLLWWFTEHGLINLDAASSGYVSSSLPYQDAEMQESKARLSQDLSGVACASYENYFLVSVPYADQYNRHTWALDNTVNPGKQQREPAWNSFWTGTRPVEWLTGDFTGQTRALYISKDYDGQNRLWEAFMPDRLDNNCPITWWAETRGYNFESPMKEKQFRYAEVFMQELSGIVDVAVFWAGSDRGKYKRVLTKRIQANTATFVAGDVVDSDEILVSLKKQSRPLTTQDGKAIISEEGLSSCDVESPHVEFLDRAFQILIVGSGPGAVKAVVGYAEPPVNTDDSGACEKDETEENFVRFDGGASEAPNLEAALVEFENEIPVFRSSRTMTVTQDGFTEVGVGTGESIVSQQDADKIAEAAGKRIASWNLQRVLPQIISLGEFNE